MNSSWFVRSDPRPNARLRLFCFPHAGGGATTYRPWARDLPASVDLCAVRPPGRETRLQEAPFQDVMALVEAIDEAIDPYLDLPAVFFGHSMGAVLAFELARRLVRRGGPGPRWLIVSGRRAPHLSNLDPPLHALSDDHFVTEIRLRYGGIPDEVLQYPELLALLLPGLRADVAALERYSCVLDEPLDCPVSAFGGWDDPRATPADLQAWRAVTRGPFALRFFPGGHFFVQSARAQVVEVVADTLRGVLTPQLEWTGT